MAHVKKCWARAHIEIMKAIPPLNILCISFLPKKLTYFHIVRWNKDICNSSTLEFQLLQAFLYCKKRLKRVWWFIYKNYILKNTWKSIVDAWPWSKWKTVVIRPSFDHSPWWCSRTCGACWRPLSMIAHVVCAVHAEFRVLSLSMEEGRSIFRGVAGILAKF